MQTTPFAMVAALLLLAAPAFSLEGWMTDKEKARQLAMQQNKDLCILYKETSWHPEKYGVPERFFDSRLFRETMQKNGFLLVEQNYPPDYYCTGILPDADFADPQTIAAGAPPVVLHYRTPKSMLVFETPSGVIYQSWTPQGMQDPVDKISRLNLAGEKSKRQHLISHIQQAQGASKYRLMKQLFSENDWPRIMPLSPLYITLSNDAIDNDHDNLSGIWVNHIKNVCEYMGYIYWMSQGWACIFDNINNNRHTPIPAQVRRNIPPQDLQNLLFLQQYVAIMRGIPSYDSLELYMENAQKEVNAIIAISPKSDIAQQISQYTTTILPLIYFLQHLSDQDPQPDKAIKAIQNISKQQLWAKDYQTQQLLGTMIAGCHLKKGDLDTGLDMLKTWRDQFPWTQQAKNADDAITRITANLAVIRELWNQQQQGNAAASAQYREHTQILLSPVPFEYVPDK